MKKIINIIFVFLATSLISGSVFSLAVSDSVSAAACSTGTVMGFPRWYRGLTVTTETLTTGLGGQICKVEAPTDDFQAFVVQIVLNVVDIAMVAVGYIALGFILLGGFQFILSLGSSDKMAAARTTILNASIGLVIAISAVAIVRSGMNLMPSAGPSASDAATVLTNILNMVYFAAGAVAVIVIIISGFTMIVSGDKPDSVAKARNGIMFAAIGIAVIILAKVITTFITGRF